MSEKKLILVTGVTGQQGGSVARHLLAGGKFQVRGFTRKPDSEPARNLAQDGVDVVRGDLSDPASISTALKGCHGVFGVTNFWEHFEGEREHGMNLVRAVAESHIEHFVFSSLPNPRQFGKGDLNVPHFEIKAKIEEEIHRLKIKATIIHVAFYYENFLFFLPPQKQADGGFAFGFPQGETPLAAVSSADVGGVVAAIFERPSEFIGRTVGVVGDDLRPAAYAEIMTKATGKKVVYNYIPRETFAQFPFPGAADLADMFEMNRLHILNRQNDLKESRRLYPGMTGFEKWAEENKQALLKVMPE